MGLDIEIKGMTSEETYHGSYHGFAFFRQAIASAYNEELGELYKKSSIHNLVDAEIDLWNALCDDGLDLFLWHSDCDGKLTPKECKLIYSALEKIDEEKLKEFDETGMVLKLYKRFLKMFSFCYKRRVNMYFY